RQRFADRGAALLEVFRSTAPPLQREWSRARPSAPSSNRLSTRSSEQLSGRGQAKDSRNFQEPAKARASTTQPTGTASSPSAERRMGGPGAKASMTQRGSECATAARNGSPINDRPPPKTITAG